MIPMRSLALPCVALALLLAACTRPQPPDPERPPEPQAGEAAPSAALRDAVQAPLDRARAVEAAAQDAAERRQAALDDAAG